jgi:hypothetical protein
MGNHASCLRQMDHLSDVQFFDGHENQYTQPASMQECASVPLHIHRLLHYRVCSTVALSRPRPRPRPQSLPFFKNVSSHPLPNNHLVVPGVAGVVVSKMLR